ncbi:MAG: DsbA family protein [Flavobacteriales bacterium]
MFQIALIITMVFSLNFQSQSQHDVATKPKLIYVFDALCGWCYGFSPVMQKIKNEYSQEFDFEIVSGGLIIGERIGPYGDFANYILNAIPGLENTTGLKVGATYKEQLKTDQLIQNSIPPAKALCYVKSVKPESAVDFAHHVQSAKFYKGKDLNEAESYRSMIENMGINFDEFSIFFNNPANDAMAFQDFERARQLGINGFPAIVLVQNQKASILTRGYVAYPQLNQLLKNALK